MRKLRPCICVLIWFAALHYRWWKGPGDKYIYSSDVINRRFSQERKNHETDRKDRANIINITIEEARADIIQELDPYISLPLVTSRPEDEVVSFSTNGSTLEDSRKKYVQGEMCMTGYSDVCLCFVIGIIRNVFLFGDDDPTHIF